MNNVVLPREDSALIEQARQQDSAAFEQLVALYRSRIWVLALRMMKNESDAEEILQETFLSAWQNLANFRGESAFSSWLYRICANFCLMRLRKKRVEIDEDPPGALPGPRFDSEGSLLSTPSYDWSRGTEEKALDNELRLAIEKAANALHSEYRTVFILKDVEGMGYQEIAEITGATVAAVKSRLHRARLALRESIDVFYKQPRRDRASQNLGRNV